jgi:hypothetical protein
MMEHGRMTLKMAMEEYFIKMEKNMKAALLMGSGVKLVFTPILKMMNL